MDGEVWGVIDYFCRSTSIMLIEEFLQISGYLTGRGGIYCNSAVVSAEMFCRVLLN